MDAKKHLTAYDFKTLGSENPLCVLTRDNHTFRLGKAKERLLFFTTEGVRRKLIVVNPNPTEKHEQNKISLSYNLLDVKNLSFSLLFVQDFTVAKIAKAIKIATGLKLKGTDFIPFKLTKKQKNESRLNVILKASPTSFILTGDTAITLLKETTP